jgi:chromosome partitioning protein
MLKTWMGERKIYRRALTQGQAVAEFDPKSKAAAEIRSIWKEIEEIVRPTATDTAVRPRRRKAA